MKKKSTKAKLEQLAKVITTFRWKEKIIFEVQEALNKTNDKVQQLEFKVKNHQKHMTNCEAKDD